MLREPHAPRIPGGIRVVGCHAEGEVGRVVVGGVPPPPGDSVFAQMRHLALHDDGLRKFLLFEPRGGAFVHANLIVPAKDPRADAGFIVMEAIEYPPMSGTNSMCVTTVLLETGMLPMVEPQTRLTLEAPGGLIEVFADCRDGKCERVAVTNLPAFVARDEVAIDVPSVGRVTGAIAYGSPFFFVVDAAQFGLALIPEEARRIVELGQALTRAVAAAHPVSHPERLEITGPSFTVFVGATAPDADGVLEGRNATVVYPGKIDRSPCGTGTSAWMAVLHARGELRAGDRFTSRSILDARFDCSIVGETDVAGRRAIIPRFAGRAWITDESRYLLDPTDPFPQGYTLTDTWMERL